MWANDTLENNTLKQEYFWIFVLLKKKKGLPDVYTTCKTRI